MTNKDKFLSGVPFRFEKNGSDYFFKKSEVIGGIPGTVHTYPKGYYALVISIAGSRFMSSSQNACFFNHFFEFDKLFFLENDK